MALSASDLQKLSDLFGASGQFDWTQLLGSVTLGTPAAGTPTLKAGEDVGMVNGQPTLEAIKLMLDSMNADKGPRNAFTQERIKSGIDSSGMLKSIGSLSGKYDLPSFAAPNMGFDMPTLYAQNRGIAPELVKQYIQETGQNPSGSGANSPFYQWAQGKGLYDPAKNAFNYSLPTAGGANVSQGPTGPVYAPAAFTAA